VTIEVEKNVLDKACKEIIEAILFCLPNAYAGTIYRIGNPPSLITQRIASGIMNGDRNKISWGLVARSGYDPPGKPWLEYRDEPNRPLEAMAWCVERQKSWTAEDPSTDARGARLKAGNVAKDFYHMEPVLVRKADLHLDMYSDLKYPKDYVGNTLWLGSDYLVVAVIKIHFRPYTIQIGSHETKVINKLSRSLGTELLSYQLRKDSMDAMHRLTKDRLNACNILADSLRNVITKSGLIFSLVKQEIGYLRDQWEQIVLEERGERHSKEEAIETLNGFTGKMGTGQEALKQDLLNVHEKFLKLKLPPKKGENWVVMQIEERWKEFLSKSPQDEEERKNIWQAIERLKKSLYFGQDPEIIGDYTKIPEELKWEWVNLIYDNTDRFNAATVEKLIEMLSNPDLKIPFRERSKRALIHLKVLAETMRQLERNTNFLLRQVLNGEKSPRVEQILDHIHETSENMGEPFGETLSKRAKANGYHDGGSSTEVRKARQK
jgi:hypothetical protein